MEAVGWSLEIDAQPYVKFNVKNMMVSEESGNENTFHTYIALQQWQCYYMRRIEFRTSDNIFKEC